MICSPVSCGCSFQSVSLQMSGSGAPGDPLSIETMGPGIVTTSADVTTPFHGQTIYETATGRQKVYNGTAWVILSGNMPMVSLLSTATHSIPDVTFTAMVLGTEIYDTDGFHSGTAGTATIPAGLGGVYVAHAGVNYAANATGYRQLAVAVTNNTGVTPAEPTSLRVGGKAMINTANNGDAVSKPLRLRAAAIVSTSIYQNSGGALDTTQEFLTLHMIRHEPSLV